MMNPRIMLRMCQSAWQIFKRDVSGSSTRYEKFSGSAVEVCRKIIKSRWNGTFFEGGSTIFANQFWIRDFGMFVEGIIKLGFKQEVISCLRWAVEVYKKNNKIGTTILGGDSVVDFWYFSADSLPFLLLGLKQAGITSLVEKNKEFFNREISKYFDQLLDPHTNLVRLGRFSTPKDVVMRRGTCVANSFLVFLSLLLKEDYLYLVNPVNNTDLLSKFIEAFWLDDLGYFRHDLEEDGHFLSADANVIPYYLRIVKDKKMHKSSIDSIKREKLDVPYPLKYHSFLEPKWTHWASRILIPNYQGNSIWTMMGPIYIKQEFVFYPQTARDHLRTYLRLIEQCQTYIEVFEPDGKSPLKGRLGHDFETGMLWSAAIPSLVKQLKLT